MKAQRILLASILFLVSGVAVTFAQGTAFTYQGRLVEGANPANGNYDLRFAIYDAAGGGTQQGVALTNSAIAVSNGLFTVTLDFGAGVFPGADRWLEIGVRTNGSGSFSTLLPRQPLTATPYAITAGNVAGPVPAAQVSGVLSSGNLPGSPTFGGTVTATGFAGSGAGLTGVDAATVNGLNSSNFWQLGGNTGITAADFLGTTDRQSLELRVNNARALRLEPASPAPNLIGGHAANVMAPAVGGGVIAGGGAAGVGNSVGGNFGAIGGGWGNTVQIEAVIAGGVSNVASGVRSAVLGGAFNAATNGLATVAGGALNVAGGYAAVVAGGGGTDPVFLTPLTNRALGNWSVVSGGRENAARGESATTSGGAGNDARGNHSTASGGEGNQSLGDWSTLGGGAFNTADFPASTVSGGQENAALNQHATVGGGVGNYALGDKSTIGGGANNLATGAHSAVPGGQQAHPTQHGQLAHAAGMFVNPGDAQRSVYVLRAVTDINTPITDLKLDGNALLLQVGANRTLTFDILVAARAEPPLTDSAGYHFRGVVKNTGGTAAFVGTPIATVLGSDQPLLWSVALGIVGDKLNLRVDGGGGGGYPATVRWTAKVDAAEVAW